MTKSKYFVVLLIAFLTLTVNAQRKEDVLYLHNGSIYRGKVLESITGVSTKIEITGRNIIVVPDTLIKMILMDQKVPLFDRESKSSPVEMAARANFYGGTKNTGGFTFITSYLFPFRISIGAGIGIEWFDHQQIPFIGDVRYYFLKRSWTPFVYAQSGYASPLSKKLDGDYTDYYGGILAGGGMGMRFSFSKRNALVFDVGYRYQKTRSNTNYPWYQSLSTENIIYNEYKRLTFSFGFVFN